MARRSAEQLTFAAAGLDIPRAEEPIEIGQQFTPAQIVGMAEADLAIRASYGVKVAGRIINVQWRYHFVAAHVRAAKSSADLIRRAIEGRYEGVYCSGKRETRRIIYANEERLRAAYELASAAPAEDSA